MKSSSTTSNPGTTRSAVRSSRRSPPRHRPALAREDEDALGRHRAAHGIAGRPLSGSCARRSSCRRGRTRSTSQSRPQYSTISTRASIAFPPAPPGSTIVGAERHRHRPRRDRLLRGPVERYPGAAQRDAPSVDPLGVEVEDVAVAHEARDLEVGRPRVKLLGAADLLRLALVQHDDPVGED